ncbi:MAG TPA: TetR/AcrR family transcriptional regulator [Candidatus Kapabacteria bacterium]|nr:TetR/AcrR family transcriptional regulator [Candidatus Kapabacteria bacterium]
MENNIKEERIKGYFINAAKEIIRGEGIVALNVRNIAERAAYSPATLYAYFKDLNDLIKECVDSFINEFSDYLVEEMKSNKDNFYKAYYTYYTRYFIQYAGIYQLLFIEANPILKNNTTLALKIMNIPKKINPTYQYVDDQYYYAVNGLLLIYMNRNNAMSFADFNIELSKILGTDR